MDILKPKHTRKFIFILILMLLVSLTFNITSALSDGSPEPGSDQDPLVSKSYVDTVVEAYKQQIEQLKQEIETLKAEKKQEQSQSFQVITVEAGQLLLTGAGTEIILRSGKAAAWTNNSGMLADVTSAKDLPKGTAIAMNHMLISSLDDGRGIKATTKCQFLVRGLYKIQGQIGNGGSGNTGGNTDGNNSGTVKPAPKTGVVNVSTLNLRAQPDTTAQILAKLMNGDALGIISTKGEWYNVKTSKGTTGWVMAKYVTVK